MRWGCCSEGELVSSHLQSTPELCLPVTFACNGLNSMFFFARLIFASYVQDYVISSDQANAMVKAASSLLSCRIEPAERQVLEGHVPWPVNSTAVYLTRSTVNGRKLAGDGILTSLNQKLKGLSPRSFEGI